MHAGEAYLELVMMLCVCARYVLQLVEGVVAVLGLGFIEFIQRGVSKHIRAPQPANPEKRTA